MLNLFYFVIASTEAEVSIFESILRLIVQSNIENLLIVIVLLAFLVKKYNLFSFLDNNQIKIIEELKDAEKNKQESIAKLKDAEEKLKRARKDADDILKEADRIANIQKEEIILKANQEADKIIHNAEKTIHTEHQKVISKLQQNLSHTAISIAEDNIRASLDEDWQKQIIYDFVDKLSDLKVK